MWGRGRGLLKTDPEAVCFYGSFPWRNEGGGAGKSDGRRWPLPRLNVNAVGYFLSEAAAEELN